MRFADKSNKTFIRTLLFDACYCDGGVACTDQSASNWCRNIASSGKAGDLFVYYQTENDSSATLSGTIQIKTAFPNAKVIKAPFEHSDVPRNCFIDYIHGSNPTFRCGSLQGILITDVSQMVPAATPNSTGQQNAQQNIYNQVPTPAGPPPSGCATLQMQDNSGLGGTLLGNEVQTLICQPQPRIRIPGLSFSSASSVTALFTDADGNKYLSIPFLGQYLAAVYRYAVAIVSILAIIVIIFAGILYILPGGSQENTTKAKTLMIGAVTGLLLSVSSYVILYTINPELVQFKNLKVLYVQGIPYENFSDGNELGQGSTITDIANARIDDLNTTNRCLYDNFLAGKNPGDEPDTTNIENAFGIEGLTIREINTVALPKFQQAIQQIVTESLDNDEIKGYIEWMRDFHSGVAPDLTGNYDGAGAAGNDAGRIGIDVRDNKIIWPNLSWRMHSIGLAVDIMSRSNWDVYSALYHGTPGDRWRRANSECRNIKHNIDTNKKSINKMGVGDLFNETNEAKYHLARIKDRVAKCAENEDLPWSSLPDRFVEIFKENGFIWGGTFGKNSDGTITRSDSMHFEYRGGC
jgi:hypothetical protein